MPQFHIYSTTSSEVIAGRIITSTEKEPDVGKVDYESFSAGVRRAKNSYIKNVLIYVITAVLQYSVVNGSFSLMTSLAGERKGFAALVVTYISTMLAILTPGLIASLGCKAVIIMTNIGYLIFSIGNFTVQYYTLLPAAVFAGYSVGSVWICGTTYLNLLGMNYAKYHKTTENKMISYTNGISMFCFSSGFLFGNAVSSLLLSPTRDNDAVKVVNSTDECSLEPENIAENVWVYALRGTLTGMCILSLFLLIFLDNVKDETVNCKKISVKNLVTNIKETVIDFGKGCMQLRIGLVLPLLIAAGIEIAYFPGTFSRVYIAECVGVHVVGYVFIVYGAASAIASVSVGKLLGHVSITSVSLLNVCLNIGLVSFLLIWERQPNYFVMFTVAILWGICDGAWSTLISSYLAINLQGCLHVAHCTFVLPYMLGYVINYGFGLVFTSEYMLLLVAGGYLVAIPPYLIAEWLSNRRSFSQCLVSPESCHDQGY
ncbi:protein unc-93 homolog A-like isoform X2 [Dysidea avara]|uniref:protein unc-93 homolog A-like isoform X2 n=1 Tax=Dysidea avara TaxID=196820 RepID=UPI0033324E48